MTWSPYPRLPVGELRDLLGVVRVLYRAAAASEPRDEARITALEGIGRTLKAVLQLRDAPPGTIDHGDAWAAAERVARELTELVGTGELGGVLAATLSRVRRNTGSMV